MKFIYNFFIFLGVCIFIFGNKNIFACSVPPDILHEFRINTTQNPVTIDYSLHTWDNLKTQVIQELESNSQANLEKNLEKILQENILIYAKIEHNQHPITLDFISGSLIADNIYQTGSYLPNPILHATYTTNIHIDSEQLQDFSLHFSKNTFQKISPLIHPYLTTDIQNQQKISDGYVLDQNGKIFDLYGDFVIKIQNQEGDMENTFSLIFGKMSEDFDNPDAPKTSSISQNNGISSIPNQTNINIFAPLETLKIFFDKNISVGLQIFGIFIALLSGMLHGLLPGHSKTLLIAHISSGGNMRKRDIFNIIASVTISHTLFIFIISLIIIVFEKGTGSSIVTVGKISSILYIIFGIFFIFLGINSLKKFQKNHIFQKNNPLQSCDCCKPKSAKQTTLVGFLAGLNPCIDAIVLFIFALSIENAMFASFLIIAFSIGIGLMLGILAYFLHAGKNFLQKRDEQKIQKFSLYTTIILGGMLILIGIFHFL